MLPWGVWWFFPIFQFFRPIPLGLHWAFAWWLATRPFPPKLQISTNRKQVNSKQKITSNHKHTPKRVIIIYRYISNYKVLFLYFCMYIVTLFTVYVFTWKRFWHSSSHIYACVFMFQEFRLRRQKIAGKFLPGCLTGQVRRLYFCTCRQWETNTQITNLKTH